MEIFLNLVDFGEMDSVPNGYILDFGRILKKVKILQVFVAS